MNKDQLIENYFARTLSQDDQVVFDNLFETDVDFRADVVFQKQVKTAVFSKEGDVLKQQLQGFENELNPKKSQNIWWLVAASVVLLISFGLYFFNTSYSTEELYASYYKPAKNIVHPIVRSLDIEDNKTKAFIAYQQKEYQSAQLLFNNLYATTQESELLFYEAISYLEINKTALAIEKLEAHKQFKDALSNKTNWYLALAYIKNDEVEKSKSILKSIIKDVKSYNYKKAKRLLKKL